jgi:hypothetical protein
MKNNYSMTKYFRLALSWVMLVGLAVGTLPTPPVSASALIDLIGPAGSGQFGKNVTVLPNGNIVVTDPSYAIGTSPNAGAVYLYNGSSGALISTLTGSAANDRVGSGTDTFIGSLPINYGSITVLSSGDFLVSSPNWAHVAASRAGALTWCSGITGCAGAVSASNSLVGSSVDDFVGYGGGFYNSYNYINRLDNGNYVVVSPYWDNSTTADVGAVTFCSGTKGCTGAISATNSLVGSKPDDMGLKNYPGNIIPRTVYALSNGNYVVYYPGWDSSTTANVGAVTFCSGTTGCKGVVSSSNSLVGTTAGDMGFYPGNLSSLTVTVLTNGNYVVNSQASGGMVTWCSGAVGCTGIVSASNSLVIGTLAQTAVSSPSRIYYYSNITALPNGSYVVISPEWVNGAAAKAGAVTWCDGTAGCKGVVSASNSLVGSAANDDLGGTMLPSSGGITLLTNGSYVVGSPNWDNGTIIDAGAVTWCSGTTGCKGVVSASNSLVGSSANDQAGYYNGSAGNIQALTNGNYVVRSLYWDNGTITDAGAVTWCSGTAGCTGAISASNSLVGSSANDQYGYRVTALTNGNYVVGSPNWDKGTISDAGAATWCSGTAGCTGLVSASNSLVGSSAGDKVGSWPVALTNGNYVVGSPSWDMGTVIDAGAETWCSGTIGCAGVISAGKSLVGSAANDQVGIAVTALRNGNYVVNNSEWANGTASKAGAATWCSGTAGCTGMVSASNSLVGSSAGDQAGYVFETSALSSGSYVVRIPNWTHAAAAQAGAVTWCSGTAGCTDVVSASNSVLGTAANGGSHLIYVFDEIHNQLVVGRPSDNRVTLFQLSAQAPLLTYLPMIQR